MVWTVWMWLVWRGRLAGEMLEPYESSRRRESLFLQSEFSWIAESRGRESGSPKRSKQEILVVQFRPEPKPNLSFQRFFLDSGYSIKPLLTRFNNRVSGLIQQLLFVTGPCRSVEPRTSNERGNAEAWTPSLVSLVLEFIFGREHGADRLQILNIEI